MRWISIDPDMRNLFLLRYNENSYLLNMPLLQGHIKQPGHLQYDNQGKEMTSVAASSPSNSSGFI
jgi:hypothetical protein